MTGSKFITFEGGEGAGKSTQLRRLAERLSVRGLEVVTTREPGGSPGAEEIRRLLVTGTPGRWDALTETLLHFAARRDHWLTTIAPALEAGRWVLCDRFADSTLVYQGYGQGLDRRVIEQLYRQVIGERQPDLTLILDVPVELGLRRAAARHGEDNRYERMDRAFHERLRAGYRELVRDVPGRCRLIDAGGPVDEVAAAVAEAVDAALGAGLGVSVP